MSRCSAAPSFYPLSSALLCFWTWTQNFPATVEKPSIISVMRQEINNWKSMVVYVFGEHLCTQSPAGLHQTSPWYSQTWLVCVCWWEIWGFLILTGSHPFLGDVSSRVFGVSAVRDLLQRSKDCVFDWLYHSAVFRSCSGFWISFIFLSLSSKHEIWANMSVEIEGSSH